MSAATHLCQDDQSEMARRSLAIELHSLLRAVESGVFVLSAPVAMDQACEIRRELWALRHFLDLQRHACGISHVVGSVDLQRHPTAGGRYVH